MIYYTGEVSISRPEDGPTMLIEILKEQKKQLTPLCSLTWLGGI